MSAAIRQKLSSIAGALLILLGVGYLVWLAAMWDAAYRFARAFRMQAGPPTLEGWAYLLCGLIAVAAGILLIFRARRRQPA